MPYFLKALLFGDGRYGRATQVYAIWWGAAEEPVIDTGVTKTWTRNHLHDPGTVTYARGEQIGEAKELIDAWAAENGKEPLK